MTRGFFCAVLDDMASGELDINARRIVTNERGVFAVNIKLTTWPAGKWILTPKG